MTNPTPIEALEIALSEIDHLYQEGVLFTQDEAKRMEGVANYLQGIVRDLPVFNQIKE